MSSLSKRVPSTTTLSGTAFLTEDYIKIVFHLLGVGVLLPWNAYISAKPYFQSRLCGDNYAIASDIELWFSILYNGASVITLAIVLFWQWLDGSNDKSMKKISQMIQQPICSNSMRCSIPTRHGSAGYTFYMVMVPLAIYLAVFFLATLLVFFPFVPSRIFLILTLSGFFICGAATSIATSGIVGTAYLFDPNIGLNPYFNGQAIGGLLVAIANFAAAVSNGSSSFLLEKCGFSGGIRVDSKQENWIQKDELKCVPYTEISWATVVYFSSGCIVLGLCMLGYHHIDQYKRLVRSNSSLYSPVSSFEDYSDSETDAVTEETELIIIHARMDQGQTDSPRTISPWSKQTLRSYHNEDIEDPSTCSVTASENSQESMTTSVWNAVQGPAICLFWTYFVSLAIFPVWTSELSSVSQCQSPSRLRNDLFSPMSFIIFNGGDLVGRIASAGISLERIHNLSSKLVLSSIARFVFFVLFLLCAAQSSQFTFWEVQSDVFSWTVQFIFAITNGALTNVAFCHAPGLVENKTDHQQVASAILNFSLSLGLLCGSFFSFPFSELVTGHW